MVEHEQTLLAEMLKESIQRGITPSLTVISDSMSPLLRTGDQVGLQELAPTQARPGQIITFSNPNDERELITHRVAGVVLEKGQEKIAAFGDRSLLFDAPVACENIIGLVIWRRSKNNVVNLLSGHGASLNQKLAQLARRNLERTSGLKLGCSSLESDYLRQANEICRQQRVQPGTRTYLRIRYLWASLIILYSGYLAQVG